MAEANEPAARVTAESGAHRAEAAGRRAAPPMSDEEAAARARIEAFIASRRPGPVRLLRSLAFNLAYWLWTAFLAVFGSPALLIGPKAGRAVGELWTWGIIAGPVAWLAGLRPEVRGRERIPEGALVFAVKHQSSWETMAVNWFLDRPAYVLKRELLFVPFIGWFLARCGMIFVDRKAGPRALRGVVRDARRVIEGGTSVVIFPEGTRSPPGRRIAYQPGVAALYTQLDIPVVPVALNSGLFWGRRKFVKWPGTISVEFLDPIMPGLDRHAFLTLLEERIEGASLRLMTDAVARLSEEGGTGNEDRMKRRDR